MVSEQNMQSNLLIYDTCITLVNCCRTIDKLRRESSTVDPTGGKPIQEVQDLKNQILKLKEENEALHTR